ncbi:MAG: FAD-dependent oxidoreductase [Rhodobacterales bacterium 32-67-9]|nr:MAG: FAD-dependent oxidoreductase [Rhodobacterales bacterium 32-67-9]
MTGRLSLDVAIIGGGTAGCAAALHLARRGLSVALFERRTVGSQASGVNFGGVREQGRDFAELPLSRRSRRIWDELPALIGSDGEFMATGHLKLARDEDQMAVLEAFATGAADYGLAVERITGNRLRADYPWLGPKVIGATLCRSDGQANPRIVAPGFGQAARRAGAQVFEHEAVRHATRDAGGFRIETEAGRQVTAATLINVAGAWGATVAGWFGDAVPIAPRSPSMQVTEPLPYRVKVNVGVVGGDVYARQTPRGNVIFGGGQGWNDMATITSRAGETEVMAAMRRLTGILPWAGGAHVIRTWSGIEGFTPDDLPVLGSSVTTPGLLHAFGFSGHGFQLGPAVGEVLAELVLTGRSETPLAPFSIERFGGVLAASA